MIISSCKVLYKSILNIE